MTSSLFCGQIREVWLNLSWLQIFFSVFPAWLWQWHFWKESILGEGCELHYSCGRELTQFKGHPWKPQADMIVN